jgi:hypothetical protein
MTCLGCMSCEQETKPLHDGRQVCAFCPDWALECEAKELLDKPLKDRRSFLSLCELKRGVDATQELRDVMRSVYEKRRSNASGTEGGFT